MVARVLGIGRLLGPLRDPLLRRDPCSRAGRPNCAGALAIPRAGVADGVSPSLTNCSEGWSAAFEEAAGTGTRGMITLPAGRRALLHGPYYKHNPYYGQQSSSR